MRKICLQGMQPRVLILLLICLFGLIPTAKAASISLEPNFRKHQPTETEIAVLEDHSGSLTLKDLLASDARFNWKPPASPSLNYGFTSTVYWVRTELLMPSTIQAQSVFLEIGHPLLDDVRAYLVQDGVLLREFNLGADLPFLKRPVSYETFLVPMDVSPQPIQVLLRIQTESPLEIPITLWEKEALLEHVYRKSTGFGFFYGAVLIIAIYNLFVFLTARDIGYLYISLYALGLAAVEASLHGVAFSFIWPEGAAWSDRCILISFMACLIFASLFTERTLLIRETSPRLLVMLKGIMLISSLTIAIDLVLPHKRVIPAGIVILLICAPTIISVHAFRMWQGYRPAIFSFSGGIVLLFSTFILVFYRIGWLEGNSFTQSFTYIGAVFQLLMFSVALGDRLKLDRLLLEEAQLKAVESQKKLLGVQIEINEELDRKVRERTDELEMANSVLKELSTTDPLTGLRNRRYFDEAFVNEYKRAFRDKQPISVLLVDIDHFKNLNDNYGHPFGDLCLQKTAEIIIANVRRPPDVAARYGGEEFVVLLPQTNLDGSVKLAESIRSEIEELLVEDTHNRVSFTASIGISSVIPQERDGHTQLLKGADIQLYRAKKNGRNRVEWNSSSRK